MEVKIPRPTEESKKAQSIPLTREQMIENMKAAIEVEELRVRLQELAHKSIYYEVLRLQAVAQLQMLSNPNPSEEDLDDMQAHIDAMKEAKKNESKPDSKEAKA